MITIRPANERGGADHGWLNTKHTFSFSDYHDPRHMGFRSLRVINEDRVEPGRGFGTHGHQDMEILSYVLEGALAHRDSLGNGSTIRPGDVQRMSAGTGVTHSEFNDSKTELVHFLQIWLMPSRNRLAPSYEERTFSVADRKNNWRLVVSPDGRYGSVSIHQDASLYATLLDSGVTLTHALAPDRHAWLQVARGAVTVNGTVLAEGDGAAVSGESRLDVRAESTVEALLFDLA